MPKTFTSLDDLVDTLAPGFMIGTAMVLPILYEPGLRILNLGLFGASLLWMSVRSWVQLKEIIGLFLVTGATILLAIIVVLWGHVPLDLESLDQVFLRLPVVITLHGVALKVYASWKIPRKPSKNRRQRCLPVASNWNLPLRSGQRTSGAAQDPTLEHDSQASISLSGPELRSPPSSWDSQTRQFWDQDENV